MTFKEKLALRFPIAALALLLSLIVLTGVALAVGVPGVQSRFRTTDNIGFTEAYTFFSATTTSATSTTASGVNDPGFFKIAGAKNVELYFSRGDTTGQGNSGSTIFRVQVSPDGTNWYEYNGLAVNSVSAGNAFRPSVGTTTIAAATSTTIAKMTDLGFYAVRCIALEVTDGEHTCKAQADF